MDVASTEADGSGFGPLLSKSIVTAHGSRRGSTVVRARYAVPAAAKPVKR